MDNKEVEEKVNKELEYIDSLVKEYVDALVEKLMPVYPRPDEEKAIRKILTTYTNILVYNRKMDQYEMVRPSKIQFPRAMDNIKDDILRDWKILENVRPNMPTFNKLFYKHISGYSTKRYKCKKNKPRLTDETYKTRIVTNKLRGNVSLNTFLDSTFGLPQVDATLAIRDIYSNGRDIFIFNTDSKEYKKIEEGERYFRKNLTRHLYNRAELGSSYVVDDPIDREKMYVDTYKLMRDYMNAHVTLAMQHKIKNLVNNVRATRNINNEYTKLAKQIIKQLDIDFTMMPLDEKEHAEFIDRTIKKMCKFLSDSPDKTHITHQEDYVNLIKAKYEEYMRKMQDGTLPVRLSNVPEDKAFYREFIEREKEKQELAKYRDSFSEFRDIPLYKKAIYVVSISALVAAYSFAFELGLNNDLVMTLPISTLLIHEINKAVKLDMDVEKRLFARKIPVKLARNKEFWDKKYKLDWYIEMIRDAVFERKEYAKDKLDEKLHPEDYATESNGESEDGTAVRRRRTDRYLTEEDKAMLRSMSSNIENDSNVTLDIDNDEKGSNDNIGSDDLYVIDHLEEDDIYLNTKSNTKESSIRYNGEPRQRRSDRHQNSRNKIWGKRKNPGGEDPSGR